LRSRYRLRSLAGILVVAVLGALAVACGNGSGDGDELQPVREQLKQMVLGPEDLPPGFIQVEETFSTNEDLAGASDGAEDQMAKLLALGRLLGYEVVFEPEARADVASPFVGVQITVSLYATSEGAKQSFAEAVQVGRETDWALSHPGFRNLEVREIQPSASADEVLWLRITGLSQSQGGDPNRLFDDFVLLRQGNARSLLRVASVSEGTDPDYLLDVIEGLLTSQVQRIDAVLSEGA